MGRVVRYVSHGSPVQPDGTQKYRSVERAAIITRVNSDTSVSLCVLNPTGMHFDLDVELDATGTAGGTWHWPPRS